MLTNLTGNPIERNWRKPSTMIHFKKILPINEKSLPKFPFPIITPISLPVIVSSLPGSSCKLLHPSLLGQALRCLIGAVGPHDAAGRGLG